MSIGFTSHVRLDNMSNTFKPLLASPAPKNIKFPVLVSPKLDGIRVCILNNKAVTRTLKPVPNHHIREYLSRPEFNGLDGEVIVGDPTDPDVFNKTTRAVMSRDGEPDFRFMVFDNFTNSHMPFGDRLSGIFTSFLFGATYYRRDSRGEWFIRTTFDHIYLVGHATALNQADLDKLESDYVASGFEGVMVRNPRSQYKFGRSTANEGILLKIKRVADMEGTIIRVEERMTNQNPQTINALGYSERSTAKAGMIPTGTLGAIVVAFGKDLELSIGSGFTDLQRQELWEIRESLPGMLCRYKYQPSGGKDLPRFPTFAGLRDAIDVGDTHQCLSAMWACE